MKFCEYCKTKLFETDRVCPACGAPFSNPVSDEEYIYTDPKILKALPNLPWTAGIIAYSEDFDPAKDFPAFRI